MKATGSSYEAELLDSDLLSEPSTPSPGGASAPVKPSALSSRPSAPRASAARVSAPPEALAGVVAELALPVVQERSEVRTALVVDVVLRHDEAPKSETSLVFLSDPDSPRAASYRILRQKLKDRGDPRVIVVTSAGRREGKTTCAANLAMALGEHGRGKVLLMEANFRYPRIASLLGFTPPACVAEQLVARGRNTVEAWKVASCFAPSLHVLAMDPAAGGKWLLNGFALCAAIERLRGEYDYVIVDAPATLGSADVNVVQDAADGVLFAARSGRTSGADLRHAVQQLAPADVLGVVLVDA